jgi:hypothetical protein
MATQTPAVPSAGPQGTNSPAADASPCSHAPPASDVQGARSKAQAEAIVADARARSNRDDPLEDAADDDDEADAARASKAECDKLLADEEQVNTAEGSSGRRGAR